MKKAPLIRFPLRLDARVALPRLFDPVAPMPEAVCSVSLAPASFSFFAEQTYLRVITGLLLAVAVVVPTRAQTGFYTLSGGSATQSGQTYSATAADQSSIYVLNSGNLTLTSPTVIKTGNASSVDQSSQYGLNAGILTASAGNVAITGGTITTNASGANGLFATGTNSKITMTGGSIVTSAEASHGVDVTYGGTIILNNVDITTAGTGASAAISTDFGGGTVTVTGGTVKTAGLKSPAIYSTGVITVTNATLTATGGPGGVIDGANSIVLNNVPLTGANHGIYVHHTAPSTGTANVTITGGSLTVTAGEAFYAIAEAGSQTVAISVKGGATITASTGVLVNATGNSTLTLTADGETLTGNLIADSTSTVTTKLQNGTTLTGAATTRATVTVDATSAWNVSAASTPAALSSTGKIAVSSLSSPLAVTGTATLGGTLLVDLDSSPPAAGTYTLLTAGAVSGAFTNLMFSPALGSAQTATLNYTGTTVTLTVVGSSSTSSTPGIVTQPASLVGVNGGTATLTTVASGSGLSYQWSKDGATIAGATNSSLVLSGLQPANAGLYTVVITNSVGSITSDPAMIGVSTTSKVIGAGSEVAHGVYVASNGNTFDQVLPSGAAVTVTAETGKITRTSFVDLTNDIVQVEFSGAGTLSIVLDNASGPDTAVNYNQPTVSYMKGHAGIVITGADDTTNVSVFSVGTLTAINQTLFKSGVTYDGVADLAFIAIASTNGKFGGVRTANASYYAAKGYTGIYAPGVRFTGPVYVGDINASGTAMPVLVLGSAAGDTWITGGDLLQLNSQPVKVSGLTQLKFMAGSTSHGSSDLPAQTNKAVLVQSGVDVTAQIVVNPSP